MTFTTTTVGDNPFAPGSYGFIYQPDQLIAGPLQLVTHNVEVMAGLLARGTVVGRISNFTLLATAGANTGNGTVGATSPGVNVEQAGSYALLATSPTVFSVTDPEGVSLGNATVGTAFTNPEVNFTITAGGTAFVAGDSFALTYQQTTGNFIACVKTANDGSQIPAAILADTVDATLAPAKVGAYFMGEFNSRAVLIDPSWTLSDMSVALQARAIHLKPSVSAADPT